MSPIRSKDENSGSEIREHYPEFVRLLTERRDELISRMDSEKVHLDEQLMTSPGDEADISVVDTSADYFLNMTHVHQKELKEIRHALERVQQGRYGLCQSCEFPIAMNRLRNLPYASLCIDCQSAIEGTRLSRRLQIIPKL